MLRALAVVVALLGSFAGVGSLAHAAGPAGMIRGTVIADSTRAPLAGAEVVVRRAADSTVVAHALTVADGGFRLDALPMGRYLFRASLLGYRAWSRDDLVLSEQAPSLDLGTIALPVGVIPLAGVAVATDRPNVVVTADRNLYSTKDMPAAAAGTATDVLRAVPELEVDMEGNVSLRGSQGVTIQFNGRTAPMRGAALTAYLRQLPGNRIERVEVAANPSAKFDPEGAAGIVNIVLKEQLDLGLSGSLYANAGNTYNGLGGQVAYQKGKLTLFGGLNVNRNRSVYRNDSHRVNLLSGASHDYRYHSDSNYRWIGGYPEGSAEYAFDKKSTLYASLYSYLQGSRYRQRSASTLGDSIGDVVHQDTRANSGEPDWQNTSITTGFRHVVTPDKNEWTLELQQSLGRNRSIYDELQHVLVPASTPDLLSVSGNHYGARDRSLQFDDSHPLGAHGKLEAGYRAAERRTTSSTSLDYFDGTTPIETALSARSDYSHDEVFQSGYVTAGTTYRKLSFQIGVRGEAANTTFDVLTTAARYENDYRSVFPSANIAYDLGNNRNIRFTYSKRIERPAPYYLNPDVPSADSLNRTRGNPFLKPKYTHSLGMQVTWIRAKGTVFLAPYFRETVNNWDQVRTVDSRGVSLTTWRNASSVQSYGANLTASLRQTGRLGGTFTVGGREDRHDASNITGHSAQDAFRWNVNTYATLKLTGRLDAQLSLTYTPAQLLAQGQTSSQTYLNGGLRCKLREQAYVSLWVNDPFDQRRNHTTQSDPTFVSNSSNTYLSRGVSLSLSWTFGKPPEQKQKKHNDAQAAPDDQPH